MVSFECIPDRSWCMSVDGTWNIRSKESESSWQLNTTAGFIWSLFSESSTIPEAAEKLSAAFPKYDKEQLLDAVDGTVTLLQEYELLRPSLESIVEVIDTSKFPTPEVSFQGSGEGPASRTIACNCNVPEP